MGSYSHSLYPDHLPSKQPREDGAVSAGGGPSGCQFPTAPVVAGATLKHLGRGASGAAGAHSPGDGLSPHLQFWQESLVTDSIIPHIGNSKLMSNSTQPVPAGKSPSQGHLQGSQAGRSVSLTFMV